MFPFITNLLTNRYWTLLLVVQAGREIVSSVTSLFYKPVLQVRIVPPVTVCLNDGSPFKHHGYSRYYSNL